MGSCSADTLQSWLTLLRRGGALRPGSLNWNKPVWSLYLHCSVIITCYLPVPRIFGTTLRAALLQGAHVWVPRAGGSFGFDGNRATANDCDLARIFSTLSEWSVPGHPLGLDGPCAIVHVTGTSPFWLCGTSVAAGADLLGCGIYRGHPKFVQIAMGDRKQRLGRSIHTNLCHLVRIGFLVFALLLLHLFVCLFFLPTQLFKYLLGVKKMPHTGQRSRRNITNNIDLPTKLVTYTEIAENQG